jgi:sugar/nucleoside kinase (ribokinase family)
MKHFLSLSNIILFSLSDFEAYHNLRDSQNLAAAASLSGPPANVYITTLGSIFDILYLK